MSLIVSHSQTTEYNAHNHSLPILKSLPCATLAGPGSALCCWSMCAFVGLGPERRLDDWCAGNDPRAPSGTGPEVEFAPDQVNSFTHTDEA